MADYLRSELLTGLGFKHGFSLRKGGVSAPPFDSLNLGRGVGDSPAAVDENYARLAGAIGYAPERLYEVSQVHGRAVAVADGAEPAASFRFQEADAVVACVQGIAVGVRTADCVAVLVVHPGSGSVSAVHSGWRGTALDVVGEAVRQLCRLSEARAEALAAAVFPHIGRAAFEVGDEVAEQLARAVPDPGRVVSRAEARPHVDLGAAVSQQLVRAGLLPDRVDLVSGCTFSDPHRFFSHRRDGAASGRHLAVVVAGC